MGAMMATMTRITASGYVLTHLEVSSYRRPLARCVALPGQNARSPSVASSAGTSVRPAASEITIPNASAGPLVLKMPISAKIIAINPTKIVPALLLIVSPTRWTVCTVAASRPG